MTDKKRVTKETERLAKERESARKKKKKDMSTPLSTVYNSCNAQAGAIVSLVTSGLT